MARRSPARLGTVLFPGGDQGKDGDHVSAVLHLLSRIRIFGLWWDWRLSNGFVVSSTFDASSTLGSALELKSATRNIIFCVILTQRATRAAGHGFWLPDSFAQAKPVPVSENRDALLRILIGRQQLRTGTGGAYAPLSEILPAARVARFVRMTEFARPARFGRRNTLLVTKRATRAAGRKIRRAHV